MQLDEFFNYKNKFIEHILTTPDIIKLINDSYTLDNSKELVYEQVFPYEHIPETIEEAKTFICVDVDIQKSYDKTYYMPVMLVWIFSHKSLLKLPEGGVRVDKLCSEICKKICGSLEYGLGELELHSVKRFAPTMDHLGKCMTFYATDFSKHYQINKYIPSNRKSG